MFSMGHKPLIMKKRDVCMCAFKISPYIYSITTVTINNDISSNFFQRDV